MKLNDYFVAIYLNGKKWDLLSSNFRHLDFGHLHVVNEVTLKILSDVQMYSHLPDCIVIFNEIEYQMRCTFCNDTPVEL